MDLWVWHHTFITFSHLFCLGTTALNATGFILFLFIYLFIFTLCSNICKMLCIIPRVTFDSVWGFFCPFPFDRHWKRCFFLFCFWASLATIVCGGCHRSVSFTVLGETWSELLQLGTQKSCVCLRSLCRPRDSAEQNPNTSQY